MRLSLPSDELPVCWANLTDYSSSRSQKLPTPPKGSYIWGFRSLLQGVQQAKLVLMYITSEDASPISSNY